MKETRSRCSRAVETRKNHQREFWREPVAEPDRRPKRPQNDGLVYCYSWDSTTSALLSPCAADTRPDVSRDDRWRSELPINCSAAAGQVKRHGSARAASGSEQTRCCDSVTIGE